MDNGMGGQPDDSMDIASMLDGGTSDTSETTPETGAIPSGQGGLSSEMAGVFKFGGRQYPNQQAAEKAHNQLYGKYSEQQSVLNQLKAALKDPQKLSALSQDPKWSPILAKLGIQQAEEDLEAEEAQDPNADFDWESVPAPMRSLYDQIQTQNAGLAIEREEWNFERKLGRSVTPDERRAVMGVISKAPSLTYAEAWKLAFHDKMLRDLQTKQKAQAEAAKKPRPSPVSHFIPGVKVDLKKSVADMSPAEAREFLRNSDEFKNLMSRE